MLMLHDTLGNTNTAKIPFYYTRKKNTLLLENYAITQQEHYLQIFRKQC